MIKYLRFLFIIMGLMLLGLVIEVMGSDKNGEEPFHPCAAAKQKLYSALMARLQSRPATDADWDVTHYLLDLHINVTAQTVSGSVEFSFQSLKDELNIVDVDLYYYLQVDGITLDGSPATLTRENDILHIGFPKVIAAGQSAKLLITYHGPADQDNSGAFYFTYHQGSPIIASLSEPTGAPTWWPCKDNPADKATAEVRITAPSSLVAASNGSLSSVVDNGDGTSTTAWIENYPISTYLISVAVSNYQEVLDTYTSPIDGTHMTLHHFIYPEHAALATTKLAITPQMISAFAGLFCEYPFINEKYGLAEFPWNGGMEHQTITSMGSSLIGSAGYNMDWINSHELAHMWWGDMITMADWPDIWLNEGFATYCEALWDEQHYGSLAYHQLMNNLATISSFQGTIYNPTQLFGRTVYYKGAWVLHMLRWVVGDQTFFQIMRTYANSTLHRYGVATTPDFQRICESVSGQSLDWFFNEWVYGPQNPYYHYAFGNIPLGNGYLTSLQLLQDVSGYPVFRMPIEIQLFSGGSDSRFRRENFQPTQQFAFFTNFTPSTYLIDPDNWILDQQQSTSFSLAPCGFYPNVTSSATDFTGIAFTNLGSTSAQVKLSLLDRSGAVVNAGGKPCLATFSLASRTQEAYLIGPLFNLDPADTVDGAVKVESDAGYLESFYMHGSPDGKSLDGNLMEAYPGECSLYIPGVYCPGAGAPGSVLKLAGVGAQPADVTLSIYQADGTRRALLQFTLAPGQSRSVDLGALPELAEGLSNGFVELDSTSPVAADCRTSATEGDEWDNPVIPQTHFSTLLYGPHFAVKGNEWQTRLRLVSPSSQSVQALVELVGEDGVTLAIPGVSNPAQVLVPAGGQYWIELSELFSLNGTDLISGSVKVTTLGGARLGGCLEFGGTGAGGNYRTALPLAGTGTRAMVFPHTAMALGYYTGVSVLNISSLPASVHIALYNKQGNLVNAVDTIVYPGAKYVHLVSELFPSSIGQVGGYLTVTSDQPVAGYEVFGSQGGGFIAAVPGRGLD